MKTSVKGELDHNQQLELAQIVLRERDEYQAICKEWASAIQKRFGVIYAYYMGRWCWKTIDQRAIVIDDMSLGGMLQWCIENRSDYENISAE